MSGIPVGPRASWDALPPNLRGMLLMLLAYAFFTIEVMGARALGGVLPTEQVVLVRAASQLILVIPFVIASGAGISVLHTRRPALHLLRGSFTVGGLFLYFYSFGHLPIADATAISFTKALFLVPLAAILLGEKLLPRRLIAVLIGFGGVLLVARPGLDASGLPVLAGLIGAGTGAGIMLVTKLLAAQETPLTIMVYVALIATAISLVPGLLSWQHPEGEAFWWLVAIGLSGPIGQYINICAIRAAEASALAPVDYVRLIFGTVAGYFVFHEVPDGGTLAGAAVIVASTLFLARREARVRSTPRGDTR